MDRVEIREGLISKVRSVKLWATRKDDPLSAEEDVDDILRYLDSKGVVIKTGYDELFNEVTEPLIRGK